MKRIHIIRRHPLASILTLVALAAVSIFGVRALSSRPGENAPAPAEDRVMVRSTPVDQDSRYTVWQPGEYVPQADPRIERKEAPAPRPEPGAWSQLSSLDVSLGTPEEKVSRNTELPAPAGMDDSMNPFERDRLIAASSVETGYQGGGPVQLPSYRVRPDVCVPGRD